MADDVEAASAVANISDRMAKMREDRMAELTAKYGAEPRQMTEAEANSEAAMFAPPPPSAQERLEQMRQANKFEMVERVQAPEPEAAGEQVEDTPEPIQEQETATQESQEPEQPEWEYLEDILEAAGVSDLSSIKVRESLKVNGEALQANLREALDGHQRHADYTQGTQKNADERRALQAERDQYLKDVQMGQQVLERAAQHELEQIDQHEKDWQSWYNQQNWTQVQQDDPATYAAGIAQYEQAMRLAGQRRTDVQKRHQDVVAEVQRAEAEARKGRLEQEFSALVSRPGWSSDSAQEQVNKLEDWMVKRWSLTAPDVTHVLDRNWFWDLAKMAMDYELAQNAGKEVIENKRKGRVLTPGRQQTPAAAQSSDFQARDAALRKQLSKSQRRADAVALIENRLQGRRHGSSRNTG